MAKDLDWAERLGRPLEVLNTEPSRAQNHPHMPRGQLRRDRRSRAVDIMRTREPDTDDDWLSYVVTHAPCSVFIAVHPAIPREVVA